MIVKTKCMHAIILLLGFALFSNCSKDSSSGGGSGTGTTLSKISIDDITLPEGNGGTNIFNINVSLDKASTSAVSVTYTTADGTAKTGGDYTAASQTITFAAGELQKTIAISVVADDIREGDETFTVTLSNATNGSIYKALSTATIVNDDTKVPFTNVGYDAPTTYAGYTLAWADEFNGTSLNATDWSFENGDGCPGVCGWGNNELEYYTDRADNLFFQNGKMIIEARKENYAGKNYTSSKILTRGKKTFKFGRLDIRAKLPTGQGIWPALWLLPQNNVYGGWPKSGELDLMEMIGREPNRTYGTLHFGPGPGSTQLGRNFTLPTGIFNDEFHVFSVEWKQDQIKWLVDGVAYSTYTKADFGANNYPFNEDFFFIINMAVGGNWPGNPDATTSLPQWFIIDYVRLYQ